MKQTFDDVADVGLLMVQDEAIGLRNGQEVMAQWRDGADHNVIPNLLICWPELDRHPRRKVGDDIERIVGHGRWGWSGSRGWSRGWHRQRERGMCIARLGSSLWSPNSSITVHQPEASCRLVTLMAARFASCGPPSPSILTQIRGRIIHFLPLSP